MFDLGTETRQSLPATELWRPACLKAIFSWLRSQIKRLHTLANFSRQCRRRRVVLISSSSVVSEARSYLRQSIVCWHLLRLCRIWCLLDRILVLITRKIRIDSRSRARGDGTLTLERQIVVATILSMPESMRL